MSADKFWSCFYEIYEALPRQGPGDRESTGRALRLLPTLTRGQRILDISCGAGTQTIDLALATEAQIVAVDNHPPFVAQLARRAAELNLGERLTAQVGDMNELHELRRMTSYARSDWTPCLQDFEWGLTTAIS